MLTGPAPSSEKALKRAGMSVKDIDLWELNEAFAAVVLRYLQVLKMPHDRINVNGGAIAMGHPLALSSVDVQLSIDARRRAVDIEATCRLKGRTGVEMEALTAASVAALTVYDMCKSVDRGMVISDVRLLHKSGGKSGTWNG